MTIRTSGLLTANGVVVAPTRKRGFPDAPARYTAADLTDSIAIIVENLLTTSAQPVRHIDVQPPTTHKFHHGSVTTESEAKWRNWLWRVLLITGGIFSLSYPSVGSAPGAHSTLTFVDAGTVFTSPSIW